MKIINMIAAIVSLGGALFAQTPIQDISVGSPLTLTGTSANVLGRNLDSKAILAYVVVFQTGANSNTFTFAHDLYFKPSVLAAGTTDTIIELDDPVFHLDLSLAVQAKVVYLQFVDGNTWGDATEADSMLLDRAAISQFMAQMSDAYTKSGQAGFLRLVNATKQDNQQRPTVRGMASHMLRLQAQSGMAGVVTELKTRLASAAQHDKVLKP